ncbi:MAG: pilus assembly protein [Clostridiales bacterium]|jgi:hypothetical protein|nr:pilus assembly protein [Clostridiales bacterium]
MKLMLNINHLKAKGIKASLTVEASMVLPLFLFFFICILYLIQIITLQEVLQEAITETGLSMAKATYFYSDFQDATDAKSSDASMLEEGIEMGLEELTDAIINNLVLKYTVASRLNIDISNNLLLVGGYDGIRFEGSKVLEGNDDIDIIIRYRIRIPIRILGLREMDMIQRVRVRGWKGHQLSPLYTIVEEDDKEERIVYITESGTVYHLKSTCSHINISIETIIGKPTWQRNRNGGIYYPCEACFRGNEPEHGTYYITPYGDRYHRLKDCSKIKRTVKEVPLSQVNDRAPCKRCGN